MLTHNSDIVDTEPSDGDIYQMLLGSIDDQYDERNDPLSSAEGSPEMTAATLPGLLTPSSSNVSSQGTPSHHRGGSGGRYERGMMTQATSLPYAAMLPALVRTHAE
jgi:hypothetical protein